LLEEQEFVLELLVINIKLKT